MRLTLSLPLAIVLLGAAPAGALTPHLVKDINPVSISLSSNPDGYVTMGGLAFFAADDSFTGRELWRTDGTEAGTFQVTDACPGECSGSPRFVAKNGKSYFFLAYSGQPGDELWVTGGLPANTFRLTDALRFPVVTEGIWSAWVASQGLLYFAADDGIHGRELWRTDGTRAGTFMVADIRLGPTGSNPGELTDFNGRLFFRADDGLQGAALWTSDGTAAGTRLVRDPDPSTAGNPGPVYLRVLGRTLFFVAPVKSRSFELWKSDGTTRGTAPLTNLRFSPATPFFDFTVLGNRLLFIASDLAHGQELWASDGTAAGTRPLTSFLNDNAFDIFNSKFFLPRQALGNRLVFRANDGLHGTELWTTDGTPKGTFLLKDACPGSCSGVGSEIGVAGGRAFFTGYDNAHGLEPWVTDGTAAGTRMIVDLCPGACTFGPAKWVVGAGKAFFSLYQDNRAFQLWRTDGTASGTLGLTSPDAGVSLAHPELWRTGFLRGNLLFNADDFEHGQELWISDGSPRGTALLRDVNDGNLAGSVPHDLQTAGGKVYFFAYDGSRFGLWVSQGTEGGTTLVLDIDAAAGSRFVNPRLTAAAEAGGRLFFAAVFAPDFEGKGDNALWRTDGTLAGTARLTPKDVQVSPANQVVALGDQVFFIASDGIHGYGLWVTDGTTAGTRSFFDLDPDSQPFDLRQLRVFQDRLYFVFGHQLWKSDGTPGGTVLVQSFAATPSRFVEHAGRLWFVVGAVDESGEGLWSTDGTPAGTVAANLFAQDQPRFVALAAAGPRLFFWGGPFHDQGFWATDGTAAGTKKLGDVALYHLSNDRARPAAAFGGQLYFAGNTSAPLLWKSDGTEAGTGPVLDQNGEPIRAPFTFQAFAGRLFFTTSDESALYQTDGTPSGTFKIADLYEPFVSDPYDEPSLSTAFFELAAAGSHLFFRKWDRDTGSELWALEAE